MRCEMQEGEKEIRPGSLPHLQVHFVNQENCYQNLPEGDGTSGDSISGRTGTSSPNVIH